MAPHTTEQTWQERWRGGRVIPRFRLTTFSGVPAAFDAGVMTIGGTVNKTAPSLGAQSL